MSHALLKPMADHFSKFARGVANLMARPGAFICACVIIVAWAASGPAFGFSETWQLIINTGTTIVTFLMVFLIQNTQNRDSKAMHLKLDELVRAIHGARNKFIDLEEMPEEEIKKCCAEFAALHSRYAEVLEERGEREGKRKGAAAGKRPRLSASGR